MEALVHGDKIDAAIRDLPRWSVHDLVVDVDVLAQLLHTPTLQDHRDIQR